MQGCAWTGEPKTAQPQAEEFLRSAQQTQDATLVSEGHISALEIAHGQQANRLNCELTALPQVDENIPVGVEDSRRVGWYDTGRVVLFDDARPLVGRFEVVPT